MDTIIYFYRNRIKSADGGSFYVQQSVRGDYALIRVGVAHSLLEGFNTLLQAEKAASAKLPRGEFLERYRLELDRWLRPFLCAREPLDEWGWASEPPLEPLLQELWIHPLPHFASYTEPKWIRRFVAGEPHLPMKHIQLLGTNSVLPELLLPHAKELLTLAWMLLQEDYKEPEQSLIDELEVEYGLPVELTLIAPHTYHTHSLHSQHPVQIWDFTPQQKFRATDIPPGSHWYDFTSTAPKPHHLHRQNPHLPYHSLTTQWREPGYRSDPKLWQPQDTW